MATKEGGQVGEPTDKEKAGLIMMSLLDGCTVEVTVPSGNTAILSTVSIDGKRGALSASFPNGGTKEDYRELSKFVTDIIEQCGFTNSTTPVTLNMDSDSYQSSLMRALGGGKG